MIANSEAKTLLQVYITDGLKKFVSELSEDVIIPNIDTKHISVRVATNRAQVESIFKNYYIPKPDYLDIDLDSFDKIARKDLKNVTLLYINIAIPLLDEVIHADPDPREDPVEAIELKINSFTKQLRYLLKDIDDESSDVGIHFNWINKYNNRPDITRQDYGIYAPTIDILATLQYKSE